MSIIDAISKMVKQYNFLMNCPKTKENIEGYASLLKMQNVSLEQFQKGFILAINENGEKFPSAQDIKNHTIQKRPKFTSHEVYEKADTRELQNIQRWCLENVGGGLPSPNSGQARRMSQVNYDNAMANRHLAVQSFYKAVRNKEINYDQVATGKYFELIEQSRECIDGAFDGLDLSSIGRRVN